MNSSLLHVSQQAERVAKELLHLRMCANDDRRDTAAFAVGRCIEALQDSYEPIQESEEVWCGDGAHDVVSVRNMHYSSAHVAAVTEASTFLELLAFRVAHESCEQATKKLLEGCGPGMHWLFHPEVVHENWELAKAIILDRLTDEWRADFGRIPARIVRERAVNLDPPEPNGDDDPPADLWQIEAGGFRYDGGEFIPLTGNPLNLLCDVFLKHHRRQTFDYDDLREAWGD